MFERYDGLTFTDAQLEEIRIQLSDYYGTASVAVSPSAQADLIQVEGMSPKDLVDEAMRLGIIRIQ